MSWYDSSSLVILPLKLVAIARALSDESFTGWRFEIALFSVEKCSVSRQSSARRKVWSSFSWEKRRTERGPTKSGRVLDEVMEGRVGFLIWIEVGGSLPSKLVAGFCLQGRFAESNGDALLCEVPGVSLKYWEAGI